MREHFKEMYRRSLPGLGRLSSALGIRKPTIFCLHSVERHSDPDRLDGSMAVTDLFLDDLLTDARDRGVPVITLEECLTRLAEGEFSPFLCLTFDDGYRDNYDVAFPVLRRHGAPATIFLATALLDRTSPMWWHPLERALRLGDAFGSGAHRSPLRTEKDRQRAYDDWAGRFRASDATGKRELVDELAASNPHFRKSDAYESALDWDMVRTMVASGLITFGAHTVTHPVLASISGAGLTEEIVGSGRRCAEMIGAETRFFAYPFGQPHEVGGQAPRIVAQAGYAAAFTTTAATLRARTAADPYRLPRIMLTRRTQNLASVDAYVSGLPETLKGTWGRPDA